MAGGTDYEPNAKTREAPPPHQGRQEEGGRLRVLRAEAANKVIGAHDNRLHSPLLAVPESDSILPEHLQQQREKTNHEHRQENAGNLYSIFRLHVHHELALPEKDPQRSQRHGNVQEVPNNLSIEICVICM